MDVFQYDVFLQYQQKSQKLKRVSPDIAEEENVIASSSKKPRSTGEALFQMTKEMKKRREMLVNQVPSGSKPEQAIALLYFDYEKRLHLDSFVKAMDLVENESKASIFLVMKPENKRDRWLELHLDTELEPLDPEW